MFIDSKDEIWLSKSENLYKNLSLITNKVEGIGCYSGLGSRLYIAYLLFKYTDKESYLTDFYTYLKKIGNLLESCNECDIIEGSAGLLILLCNIYKDSTAKKIIKSIHILKNHLFSKIIYIGNDQLTWGNGLVGFSHGNSGVLYALSCYNELFPDITVQKVIYKALLYEKEYRYKDGWYDLRNKKQKSDFSAWCHGAPGIILARSKMITFKNLTPDITKIITEDLQLGEKLVLKKMKRQDYSLCHGTSGNFICFNFPKNTELNQLIKNHIKETAINNRTNKYNLDWSLMLGISGVIYTDLYSKNKNLPNILLFEI